jgi:hypothetical protein
MPSDDWSNAESGAPTPEGQERTKGPQVIVENRTARQIVITGRSGGFELLLRPFETVEVTRQALQELDYEGWSRRNFIHVKEQVSRKAGRGGMRLLTALARRVSALVHMTFSSLTFLLVMVIGFGLPLMPLLLWLDESWPRGAEALPSSFLTALFWQFVRWFFVGMASVMPAILYFLFYRAEVRTLRENFLRDIVQMSPNVDTLDAAEDLYGSRIDEVYGNIDSPRELLGTHLPILASTVLITLCWVLALPLTEAKGTDLMAGFQPTMFGFGFLGTYFYVLNMVFRRYVRSDLGPKAYNHISLRLLTTLVLVEVLRLLPGTDTAALHGFAFLVGIVPETALVTLQDFLKNSRLLKSQIPSLHERCPLTDLEGITLYDRARLLEEGIENVENLAHHNFVDLLLWTRIPTERLVDLMDQAILYLHVQGPRPVSGEEASPPLDDMAKLRRYGIRTATDLLQACESARQEGPGKREAILSLLDDAQEPHGLRRLEVILSTLLDDTWLGWLRHWMHRAEDGQKQLRLEELPRREGKPSAVEQPPPLLAAS